MFRVNNIQEIEEMFIDLCLSFPYARANVTATSIETSEPELFSPSAAVKFIRENPIAIFRVEVEQWRENILFFEFHLSVYSSDLNGEPEISVYPSMICHDSKLTAPYSPLHFELDDIFSICSRKEILLFIIRNVTVISS